MGSDPARSPQTLRPVSTIWGVLENPEDQVTPHPGYTGISGLGPDVNMCPCLGGDCCVQRGREPMVATRGQPHQHRWEAR